MALQIGHRISVDLDWFGHKQLPKNLLKQLQTFFSKANIEINVQKKEELTVFINNIQVTFFCYPYPWAEKPKKINDFYLASILQIAAMKAQTINRRAAFKDYADLYFILKYNNIQLEQILLAAKKVFPTEFNSRLFLEQLIYMEDIAESGVNFILQKVTKKEIQDYFGDLVKTIKL